VNFGAEKKPQTGKAGVVSAVMREKGKKKGSDRPGRLLMRGGLAGLMTQMASSKNGGEWKLIEDQELHCRIPRNGGKKGRAEGLGESYGTL